MTSVSLAQSQVIQENFLEEEQSVLIETQRTESYQDIFTSHDISKNWKDLASAYAFGKSSIFKAESGVQVHQSTSLRFQAEEFQSLFSGETVIDEVYNNKDVIKTIQNTLYSFGYELGDAWIDGKNNDEFRLLVKKFQLDFGLKPTGIVDQETLLVLDELAREQTQLLKDYALANEEKLQQYKVIVDRVGEVKTAFVLTLDDEPVARYKVSPGRRGHTTPTRTGEILKTKVRTWWIPPNSPWARGDKPQPPGINNAMGLVKHQLFGAIYIHGTPKKNEKYLGQRASHGCIRMSPTNILDITENYIGKGVQFEITADSELSANLNEKFSEAGIDYKELDAGREYLAAYTYEEWGESDL